MEDPISKSETIFAAAKISAGNWTVLVEVPPGTIQATITNFTWTTSLMAGAGIIVVALLLMRLAQRLAGKIKYAAAAAAFVAQGDLSRRYAGPNNLDESGQL